MDRIIEITGHDLRMLAQAMGGADVEDVGVVRIAIDGDAVKVKIGWGIWSPPLGHLDPTCRAARLATD